MALDKDKLAQVQFAESAGRKDAVSPKGARGVMQVMPATAKDPGFGLTPANQEDPRDVARLGQEYVDKMMEKYGNEEVALAAYNWGPGNVDKWLAAGGDYSQLPAETRAYIENVKNAPTDQGLAYGDLRGNQQQSASNIEAELEQVDWDNPDVALGGDGQDTLGYTPLSAETSKGLTIEQQLEQVDWNNPDPIAIQSNPAIEQKLEAVDWDNVDEDLYDLDNTATYFPEIAKDYKVWTNQPDMSDEDAASEMASYLRFSTNNTLGAGKLIIDTLREGTTQEKQALANMLEYWEKVPKFTQPVRTIAETIAYILTDPATYISAGVGGIVAKGAQKAGMSTLISMLRGTVAGAAVDATTTGGIDAANQGAAINVGAQEEFSPSQTAIVAGAGGALSLAVGGVGAAVGSLAGKSAAKGVAPGLAQEGAVEAPGGLTKPVAESVPTTNQEVDLKQRTEDVIKKVDPEYAGSINMDRIGTPESVKDLYRAFADENDLNNKPAETWNYVLDRAQKESWEDLQAPEGVATTSPQVAKLRQALASNRTALEKMITHVEDLRAKGLTEDSDELMEAIFARDTLINEGALLQSRDDATAANLGRMLNLRRMVVGSDFIQTAVMRDMYATYGKDSEALAQAILKAKGDKKKISNILEKQGKGVFNKAEDMVLEYWYNSILSAWDTSIINALGASAATVSRNTLEAGIAQGLAGIRRGLGGESKLAEGDAAARASAIVKWDNVKRSLRVAGEFILSEQPLIKITDKIKKAEAAGADEAVIKDLISLQKDIIGVGGSDWRRANTQSIPGFAGKFIRIPGRLMASTDAFNKTIGRKAALNAAGNKAAIEGGIKPGTQRYENFMKAFHADPPKGAMEAAAREALANTFQTNNAVAKAIDDIANLYPLPGLRFATRFVFPFARTLTNIVDWTAKRTPLGMFQFTSQKSEYSKGLITAEEVFARQIVGSAYIASGYAMYQAGILTGTGPEDWKERKALEATGWKPFSVKSGEGEYASIIRTDPAAMFWQIGALLAQIEEEVSTTPGIDLDTAKEISAYIYQSAMQMATITVVEKTMLNSLGDIVAAVQQDGPEGLAKIGENIAAGFVPNILNRVGQETDEYKRLAVGVEDKLTKRLPGARESLPIDYGLFGEALKEDSNFPGLSVAISKTSTPVTQESGTQHLYDDIIVPLQIAEIPAPKDIAGVTLTAQERSIIEWTAGQIFRNEMQLRHDRGAFAEVHSADEVSRKHARDIIMNINKQAHNAAIDITLMEMLQRDDPARFKQFVDATNEEALKKERLNKKPDYLRKGE